MSSIHTRENEHHYSRVLPPVPSSGQCLCGVPGASVPSSQRELTEKPRSVSWAFSSD